jgi:NAD(P)-dependent dehydrogenase (short-subunit alcohol dehydrogenase family)
MGATKAKININEKSVRFSEYWSAQLAAVAPGPIWTPLIPSTMPPDQVEGFGQQVPMGRPGQPAELAPVYLHFRRPDRRDRRQADPVREEVRR